MKNYKYYERFHAAESRVMLASTMPSQGKGRMKSNYFLTSPSMTCLRFLPKSG